MRGTVVKEQVAAVSLLEEPLAPDDPSEASELPEAAIPRRRGGWLLGVVAIAAIAGGGWIAHHFGLLTGTAAASRPGEAAETKAALGFASEHRDRAAATPAKSAETVRAEQVPGRDVLRLTGSLAADERSSVASNTSGIVAEVRVDRGSLVRKGDVLVQIDPTDAKNKLAEGQAMLDELKARLGLDEGNLANFNPEDEPEVRLAKAAADLAGSRLRRAKELYDKKVISTEEHDQAVTENELATQRYRQARFQIRQAYQACRTATVKLAILQKAVDDTTIRAPMDGWVAERLVSVGEQISAGMQATKVVTLVRTDPLRLLLVVPQQDIGHIQPGQRVHFRVDSFPDRVFEAQVRFIAPVVAADTRSMIVEAVTPNPDGLLRPGLFATAEVELGGRRPDVVVPVAAVEKTGEVGRVCVVEDGVARQRIVALGEQTGDRVVVRSGLAGTELLVSRPERFHDGDKVRP